MLSRGRLILKTAAQELSAQKRLLPCLLSCRNCHTNRQVRPGNVSSIKIVPEHIQKPPYVADNYWFLKSNYLKSKSIEIKNKQQLLSMVEACQLAREMLDFGGSLVRHGVTTDEIDQIVHEEIVANNAYPSPLLYKGFPKSICTSVNNVACHGIPDDRELQEGDIVNIDVTVFYNGFHGDCSETYIVGETTAENEWLIYLTRECRDLAIEACGPGVPFNTIGKTIGAHAANWSFQVVDRFCGHGIGEFFHGPPDILHIDNENDVKMQPGMTFTIEPILSDGSTEVRILKDGWTAVTVDDSNTAQFEHTIVITDNGAEILTK